MMTGKERLRNATLAFAEAFQRSQVPRVLRMVFDRLHVLRNQIVRGDSTGNSATNRAQVKDGAAILTFLMPEFVDLTMCAPESDWGQPEAAPELPGHGPPLR